ncbi:hypothetical protein EDD11_002830 [Mortierella claussenii]|nr:hypothetical protein EDD11_002830 [Mortierella claussenii]
MHQNTQVISIIFFTFLLFAINPSEVLQVQGQPQPCGGAAFARVGNTFYLQGGATSGDNLLQHFWALDLTKTWTTSKPTWSALPLGPANAYHSAGYSADNKSFITFGRDTSADPQVVPSSWINIFDITAGAWSFSTNPPYMSDNSRRDFSVVTNPRLNKNYILGGDAGNDGGTYTNIFSTFDPSSRALTEVVTPVPGPQNISTYSAVWVPRLNAMMVIGGSLRDGAPQDTDGSLVAVFGGFTSHPGTGDPYVYILDTTTWIWMTATYNGRGRGNAACTVVDDTFMIWGGFYSTPNTVNGVPVGADTLLLFSLSKKSWMTTYTPSAALSGSYGGNGGNGNGSSGNSGNGGNNSDGYGNNPKSTSSGISTAAIGGVVAGCAALVLVVVLTLLEKHRRKKMRKQQKPKNEKPYDNYDGSGQANVGVNMMGHQHHHHQLALPRLPPPTSTQALALAPEMAAVNKFHSLKPTSESLLNLRQSIEGGSSTGYSNPTTPTTLQFLLAGSDHGGGSDALLIGAGAGEGSSPSGYHDGRQSYLSDATSASVYYPPPPSFPRLSEGIPEIGSFELTYPQNVAGVGNNSLPSDPQSIALPEGYYPFRGMSPPTAAGTSPTSRAGGADQYHDTYQTMRHASMMSSHSGYSDLSSSYTQPYLYDPRLSPPALPVPKRPVSGPQGGPGFGSMMMDQPVPRAPQAILQHQSSIHSYNSQYRQQQ